MIDAAAEGGIVALEEIGLFDQVNGDIRAGQHRMPKPAFDEMLADRDAEAQFGRRERLSGSSAGAVERHDDGAIDAALLQGDRQGGDDIGQAPRFRKSRNFRRRMQTLHAG